MRDGRQRVIIENVTPQVEGGRFAAKRALGEKCEVGADVFTDGHDKLKARLLYRLERDADYTEIFMEHAVNDRWSASFPVTEMEVHRFTVEGWVDHYGSWLSGLTKKFEAGQDVGLEIAEGAGLLRETAGRAKAAGADEDAAFLTDFAARLAEADTAEAVLLAGDPLLTAMVNRYPEPELVSRYDLELSVMPETPRAAFSTWYELFPRSCGAPGEHGTLTDVIDELDRIAEAGFDVLYMPPIHPIGSTFRKGKNNTPEAESGDVGSPWAIGSQAGGHKSVHPRLGTLEDFDRLLAAARERGIDVALDIAFQCSPDHPYVREHPEWFKARPDGSIQYAENPPKKYQDIYPFDFECENWRELWEELKSVFTFWAARGVRVFRVDNPHTKPLPFWQWCLGEVKKEYPESVFLSEAFTRPKIMYRLAKAGFTQSYTYFTWRNSKYELTTYMQELVENAPRDYFRPIFWPNTPDILPQYLQYGGRPAFIIRLALAATLSSNYGIYGPAYEAMDAQAMEEGAEEYLRSEKYELKDWELDKPGGLYPFIKRLNRIRRDHPALRQTWNISFLPADNEFVLFFAKYDDEGGDTILVAVNLDPHHAQSAWLTLPVAEFGIEPSQSYMVHDLVGDDKFIWQGERNFMDFDPKVLPVRIFKLKKRLKRETDFDYFM